MKGDVFLRFIGSKTLLLNEIEIFINENIDSKLNTFVDLFAGANVVGEYFKKDYRIISNDILYFSYCYSKAFIENNSPFYFDKLDVDPFEYLNDDSVMNNLKTDLYYTKSYTQFEDEDTMYFSIENGKKIDFIREQIEQWKDSNKLSEYEYYYLISCLIESISLVSNTTGTYGAYLKKWDKRALKPLKILPLDLISNNQNNLAFNQDSNILISKIEGDIVYIDTPYNSRQYAANYHVLENIAKHSKPEVKGITKLIDWSDKKSLYSTKSNALSAMKDLLSNIKTPHIILSYNDEGIIDIDDLITLLKDISADNTVKIREIPYRKYQSKLPSNKKDLKEYLFYISTVKEKGSNINIPVNSKKVHSKNKYLKSPLNYIGGKHRLLPQIIPLFPKKINTFVDLFSGGANVGINVKANKYIFNDMNERINEMFRFFGTQDPDILISNIKSVINKKGLSKNNQEAYLTFRSDYNDNPNPLDLYILVSFSYNYQIRFNNNMEFNNPFGRNRSSFSQNMEKNIYLFTTRLKEIDYTFTDLYFEDFDFSFLTPDDFVYMDPPYLITTGNYNDGNRGFKNWTESEERKLLDTILMLDNRGIKIALSNVLNHKGKTNHLLTDFLNHNNNFFIHPINFNYNNASHNSKTSGSEEVLITNYNPN